jgi:hypothetical protein
MLPTLVPLSATSMVKEGRHQAIRMASFDDDDRDPQRLLTMRAYASEPYYTELLAEAQPRLAGATLNNLLSAWTIVSKVSRLLREQAAEGAVSKPDDPGTWMPKYAPVLQQQALVRALCVACETSLPQSRALAEFFVFRGKADQELWAQPLVPVGEGTVVPLFAATSSPNLRRLVDVWLKQLGVDMGLRGPAFEAHVRSLLREQMRGSPLLSPVSMCLERELTFTPPGGREEEIDVVALVGDVLLIGEAKCFLEPAEAKETAMHRSKVIQAVDQVKRKASAVSLHKAEFRQRAAHFGLQVPEEFVVVPLVILNSAVHSGMPVDGVAVVDEHILGVYFRGRFVEMAVQEVSGDLNTLRERILYGNTEEGIKGLCAFLKAPAQMEPLLAGTKTRWVPIPGVSRADWIGQFLTVDCVPAMPELEVDSSA